MGEHPVLFLYPLGGVSPGMSGTVLFSLILFIPQFSPSFPPFFPPPSTVSVYAVRKSEISSVSSPRWQQYRADVCTLPFSRIHLPWVFAISGFMVRFLQPLPLYDFMLVPPFLPFFLLFSESTLERTSPFYL